MEHDVQIPRQLIEKRAYQLYVERGRQDGHAQEHWFAAISELRATAFARAVLTTIIELRETAGSVSIFAGSRR